MTSRSEAEAVLDRVPLVALRELPAGLSIGTALECIEWAHRHGAFREQVTAAPDADVAPLDDPAPGAEEAAAPAQDSVADEPAPPVRAAPPAPAKAEPPRVRANQWTPEEDDRLIKLIIQRLNSTAMLPHFPARTEKAIQQRVFKLRASDPSLPGPLPRPTQRPLAVAPALPPAPPAAPEPPPAPPAEAQPPTAPEPEPEPVPEDHRPVGRRPKGPILTAPVPEPADAPANGRVREYLRFYRDHIAGSRRGALSDLMDARADYNLFAAGARGVRIAEIAQEEGIAALDLVSRLRALVPPALRDRRGVVTIDGTSTVLEGLRRLAWGEEA